MKIEQLTSEQTSIFPSIVDKFVKLGLSTQPLNQPKAIEAINLAYQYGGLDKPKEIIFVKSPIIGSMLTKKLIKSQNYIYPFNTGYDIILYSVLFTFEQLGFSEEMKSMNGNMFINKECGFIWIFENLCVVSERPTSIVLNEQGQLHNLKGPAISWSDGYSQYYINGKFIHSAIEEKFYKELSKYQDLKIKSKIDYKICEQPWYLIRNKVCNPVYNQIKNQVNNQVWNQIWNQIGNQVENQVWIHVYNQVWIQVYNQVKFV